MPQGPRLLAFGKYARQTFAHFCADVTGIFRKRWVAQQGALLSLVLTDVEATRVLADMTSPRNS
jgi:hypothetical protein